ncbi:VWA domain-containing protein [Streptomyces sp. NPDC058001]|uniref:VWA domain-containing protein n=1 Tax=Streptomyces sp. NPDC058001 TaxID=3346300 RepID=UPI0036E93433
MAEVGGPGTGGGADPHGLSGPGDTAAGVVVGLEVSQVVELPAPDDSGRQETETEAAERARMYAVLTVSVRKPPVTGARADAPPRAEILLVDHSSSMVSPPSRLGAARAAALAALDRIPDGTLFALVAGRDRAGMIYPGREDLSVAGPATRREAAEALAARTPGGGTAMGSWLELAARLLRDGVPAETRARYVCHALLLTDGRNEPGYESRDELTAHVAACRGQFTCDVVGIGDAWETAELRLITEGLGGRARAVGDLARLPGELARLTEEAVARDVRGLRLRLAHRKGVTVHSFEQVHPTRMPLTPTTVDRSAVESGAGGPVEEYETSAWREETRDYLLCVSAPYLPEQENRRLLLTAVTVEAADSEPRGIQVPEPAAVFLSWSSQADLYSRLHPRVAHYRHEERLREVFEDGCRALRAGATDEAEAYFGEAWTLAVRTRDTGMQEHLLRLVRVMDATKGEVELRPEIPRFDIEAARVHLSETVLPGRDSS